MTGTALVTAEKFRTSLQKRKDELKAVLPERVDPDHFIEVAMTAYLDNETLQRCEPLSVWRALRRSARFGLRPDNEEAAIIPYRDNNAGAYMAEFMPMFKGVVRTILRTGAVKKVEARVVRSGDAFEYHYGLSPDLRHTPAPDKERGDITHAYAIAFFPDGDVQFEVMDRDQLDRVQKASKASNSPAWRNWKEEMCRKAVVKRLSKYLEVDATAAALVRFDDSLEAGTGYEPEDFMPDSDTRSLSERARHHADRQTAEIRDRLAEQNGREHRAVTTWDLDSTIQSGKHAGRTWRWALRNAREYVEDVVSRGWLEDELGEMGREALRAHLADTATVQAAEVVEDDGAPEDDAEAAEAVDPDVECERLWRRGVHAAEILADDGKLSYEESEELDLLYDDSNLAGLRLLVKELEERAGIEPDLFGGE